MPSSAESGDKAWCQHRAPWQAPRLPCGGAGTSPAVTAARPASQQLAGTAQHRRCSFFIPLLAWKGTELVSSISFFLCHAWKRSLRKEVGHTRWERGWKGKPKHPVCLRRWQLTWQGVLTFAAEQIVWEWMRGSLIIIKFSNEACFLWEAGRSIWTDYTRRLARPDGDDYAVCDRKNWIPFKLNGRITERSVLLRFSASKFSTLLEVGLQFGDSK